MSIPDRFLGVILKLSGQNSWEDTIFVPSFRLANLSFNSWFSLGPNAKLFVNMTLHGLRGWRVESGVCEVWRVEFVRCGEWGIKEHSVSCRQVRFTTYVADCRMSLKSDSRKSPFISSNSPKDFPYQSIQRTNSSSMHCAGVHRGISHAHILLKD